MINKLIWLSLSQQTREKIAKDFGMRKSQGCEVVDGRVESDGFDDKALMLITEEALDERLLKSQSVVPQGFMKKWEYYIADIESKIGYVDGDGSKGDLLVDMEVDKPLNKEVEEILKEKELQKHIPIPKEVLRKIIDSKTPKKIGRPKGSKSKVGKNKKI